MTQDDIRPLITKVIEDFNKISLEYCKGDGHKTLVAILLMNKITSNALAEIKDNLPDDIFYEMECFVEEILEQGVDPLFVIKKKW